MILSCVLSGMCTLDRFLNKTDGFRARIANCLH